VGGSGRLILAIVDRPGPPREAPLSRGAREAAAANAAASWRRAMLPDTLADLIQRAC